MNIEILQKATSFAVVGASSDQTKVGHQILANLKGNPSLTLYPVNPKGGTILDLKVYESLHALPTVPDVVIIAVKVPLVSRIIDDCIAIHTTAVIIITSGFAEYDVLGAGIESQLKHKLGAAGIALLGPNSMGYLATHAGINASFGPGNITPGNIAIISQSGAIISALLGEYHSAGLGISQAYSLGNGTGISENESLDSLANDPATKLIVIYLESIRDPRTLLSIASQLSRTKPIFLLKGGDTVAGQQAASSHTAALATSSILLSSLAKQAGIVQVDNFEQLVRASIAAAKASFLPENIMLITNAGGPAVTMVDELARSVLPLSTLSASTMAALTSTLPGLKIANPLDLLGDATPALLKNSLTVLTQDPSIDVIAVILTKQAVTDLAGLGHVLSMPWGRRLIFVCLAGGSELDQIRQSLKSSGVITANYPNEIVETLSLLYQAKHAQNTKYPLVLSHQQTQSHPYPRDYHDLLELVSSAGISSPTSSFINNPSDLSNLNHFPLVAKTTSLDLVHKAKLGAVVMDIIDESSARLAYDHLTQWGTEVVFQHKITGGIESLLGAHHDPFWGWYLALGLGGALSDTYQDQVFAFLPISSSHLASLLKSTMLDTLLTPSTRQALLACVERFQSLVLSTKDLVELEINPLFITPSSLIAGDLKRR